LREAGIETPELDARLLLCHATGISLETYVADRERPLAPEACALYGEFIERRLKGEPVSRILGGREFYGRSFRVDCHTLDPRPDTETLIEAALDMARGTKMRPPRLLDLGTGTGCILLTLLAEMPEATGVGVDVSPNALRVAAENARRLGLGDRASFLAGDWLEPVSGRFDLILANPPYLASAELERLPREVAFHDPRLALDGGKDGLEAYRRIAAGARPMLALGGALLLEIGLIQGAVVRGLFEVAGFLLEGAWLKRDLAGRPRVVVARA
jgi:release factor glutamine methyltransferase